MLVLALLSLGYAVYRSTAARVTAIENGQQVVYGDPQHGLLFGLAYLQGSASLASCCYCWTGMICDMIIQREENKL